MAYAIDVSKGQNIGTVSAQWAARSADQRFTSLSELHAQVLEWAEQSRVEIIKPAQIVAKFDVSRPDYLALAVGDNVQTDGTHWAFEQVCRAAGTPPNYMRSIPGPLAAVNLNYGLKAAEQKEIAAYVRKPKIGDDLLRGLTSPRYGRICDHEVVKGVMNVAGNGTGDTRWKVPGTINWSSQFGVTYNPEVNITKQNTTLYASDRDVFLFLVDDKNPIEVGKLANGDPDLMFRGFYVWNSEVGAKTYGFASMYLRGVCQNRNLWGVEQFRELTFKHTSGAPDRFAAEASQALLDFADLGQVKLIAGVKAAKAAIVAKTDEDAIDWLDRYGFSAQASKSILETSLKEEQTAARSVWDFAQAVSAIARGEEFQEDRLRLERIAGKMLDKVKVTA
ncbi:hypothetical protein UFOVP119_26 [uncultured Caudovirales phage]|uniref:DUF932 domain-containing protein n=1 Tax=uncultured Caudovirales phage TaxID=2100421 RepID=A0A6J5LAG5_9CAUD|nr:hypothetical protein UFOVP119_26 [uncultured Caudovirales phage]